MVFIGSDKQPVIFGLVGDGICDSCGKFGCHMKIFLTVCDWLHGHGVDLGCAKIIGVFLGEFWNIFGSLASCWVLVEIFYILILEDSW